MLLAFPHIYVDVNGSHQYHDGALFALPPELCDPYRLAKYLEIKGVGWQKTEFSYMAYIQSDEIGNKYILPGLFLTDTPIPAKRFPGYKAKFSRSQVERYLHTHLDWQNDIRKKSELELTALVHDLRHLSSSIYHSATEADKAVRGGDRTKSIEDIKTVIASQTMLKVRIDYLDFANSVDRFTERESIPVFSRVDKVIRCFRASARHKGVEIQLSGESYRLAYGPNILDIVPYTLIENAIKYAPKESRIVVHVVDHEDSTRVTVESKGPALEPGEFSSIFRRGFRGANAVRFRSEGTGLGLAVAHNVVEVFGGSINVNQEPEEQSVNGVRFRDTCFTFSVPTSGEDMRRKAKFKARWGKGMGLASGRG